ncbi:hypothetical protein [Vagococcus penaei]|uniref:hypothetical protein n=1 Tax=Vagococcus penaei TaxID=633807 RepID=UPI00147247B4|nr:hypothetical protein [Vagococcus penaei]
MLMIRRSALLLVVLIIGMLLGTLGWKISLLVLTPLLFIWLMVWDEKSYDYKYKEHKLR